MTCRGFKLFWLLTSFTDLLKVLVIIDLLETKKNPKAARPGNL